MRLLLPFLSAFIILSLQGCDGKGPDTVKQLAAQGLLSGALSDDGDYAVIGSVHHGGSYWDVKRGERMFDWNHASGEYSALRAVAISGDGNTAVTAEEDAIVVWRTSTGESKAFWQAPDRVMSIALDKQGNRALIGTRKGQVLLFDLLRGGAIHSFQHEAEVRNVAISEDGTIGLSGSDDRTAKAWDLKAGKPLYAVTLENQIKHVSLSDSGELAFSTSLREDAIIWDTSTGAVKFRLPNRYTNYTASDFSDDEKFFVAGTFQGMIKKWQISSGSVMGEWKAKPRQAYGGASSKSITDLKAKGKNVVALSSDGTAQMFAP